MKKNELKKLAVKIAAFEKRLAQTQDEKEKKDLELLIMKLSEQVESLDEIFILDELIQKMLKKS